MYKLTIDLGHTNVFRLLCAQTLQLISSNENFTVKSSPFSKRKSGEQ